MSVHAVLVSLYSTPPRARAHPPLSSVLHRADTVLVSNSYSYSRSTRTRSHCRSRSSIRTVALEPCFGAVLACLVRSSQSCFRQAPGECCTRTLGRPEPGGVFHAGRAEPHESFVTPHSNDRCSTSLVPVPYCTISSHSYRTGRAAVTNA